MNEGFGIGGDSGTGGGGGNSLQNGSGTTNGSGTYTITSGITIKQFWLDGILKQEGDGWSYTGTTLTISPDVAGVYFSYNYTS